ncbi:exonuclease domain-containing protein [Vibrio maritimus]|uniref:exonuclease domain-containing protein n=1 Tax=Vibrio maritimus TaxID=990268 RepID=UPI003734F1AF
MFTEAITRWLSKPDQANLLRSKLAEKQWRSCSLTNYLAQPLVSEETPIADINFVAIDFETTGLEFAKDRVLSIGLVELTLDTIDMTSVTEVLLRNEGFIKPESAIVNELMPSHIEELGIETSIAFDTLLDRIKGKVVIAHSACIEQGFLNAYLDRHYNLEQLPCHFIDTLNLEKKHSYLGKSGGHSSLQLDDLRDHYNLPQYLAHSAASDALGCAELFLAQVKRLQLCRKNLSSLLYR